MQLNYMGLNKLYGTNRNKSMLAVFICHQVRFTYVCNDTIAYVKYCNFPPPRSEGGVASASSLNKERTPGFQGTVSLAGCLLDGGYSQEGGSLTEGSVGADTCKHTSQIF